MAEFALNSNRDERRRANFHPAARLLTGSRSAPVLNVGCNRVAGYLSFMASSDRYCGRFRTVVAARHELIYAYRNAPTI